MGEIDAAERDVTAGGHEQAAAEAGAAAAGPVAGSAGAARRDRVLDGQVFDGDGAVIDEEPAMDLSAVEHMPLAVDGQARSAAEIDRREVVGHRAGQRDVVGEDDRIGRRAAPVLLRGDDRIALIAALSCRSLATEMVLSMTSVPPLLSRNATSGPLTPLPTVKAALPAPLVIVSLPPAMLPEAPAA